MEAPEVKPTPTRGVPVELDKTRYLRYSLATRKKIRAEFGDEMAKGVSDERLAKLLWFGLAEDDPTLTVEQVENLIDMEMLPTVMEAVQKAMGSKAKATITNPPTPTPAAVGSDQVSTKSGD